MSKALVRGVERALPAGLKRARRVERRLKSTRAALGFVESGPGAVVGAPVAKRLVRNAQAEIQLRVRAGWTRGRSITIPPLTFGRDARRPNGHGLNRSCALGGHGGHSTGKRVAAGQSMPSEVQI